MTQLRFKDKYRVESIRLANRDYAANGWYFITICTQNRTCFFGMSLLARCSYRQQGKLPINFGQKFPTIFPIHTLMHMRSRRITFMALLRSIAPNIIDYCVNHHKCRDAKFRVSTPPRTKFRVSTTIRHTKDGSNQ